MRDPFEDPSGEDPANWDCCDEHETVFWKGTACEKCLEEEAQATQQPAPTECDCPARTCQPESNVGKFCWRSGFSILASDFAHAVSEEPQ